VQIPLWFECQSSVSSRTDSRGEGGIAFHHNVDSKLFKTSVSSPTFSETTITENSTLVCSPRQGVASRDCGS